MGVMVGKASSGLAVASARSTRIAASLSGPSDATLCKVTVFFDAMWSTSPEPVEPAGGPGVVDGVPGIAMTQVILDETQIVAPVGEIIAAGMAQHVRRTGGRPARVAAVAMRWFTDCLVSG